MQIHDVKNKKLFRFLENEVIEFFEYNRVNFNGVTDKDVSSILKLNIPEGN